MKKIFGNPFLIALMLIAFFASSCGNRAKKDLNHLLMELAGTDYTIEDRKSVV